ncbi:hypothetical protein STEG23_016910 [Scotinomys teguina]
MRGGSVVGKEVHTETMFIPASLRCGIIVNSELSVSANVQFTFLGGREELDSKILVLKILHTGITEHGEIIWKFYHYWIAFIMGKGFLLQTCYLSTPSFGAQLPTPTQKCLQLATSYHPIGFCGGEEAFAQTIA